MMAKLAPLEVFEANIADAERLIGFTRILLNTRTRRMRAELRDRIGEALRVPRKQRELLDCVESGDIFLVLKPNGAAQRHHFDEVELRPLLRQAIVAIAAAVESYVAEKACTYVRDALSADPIPRRLLDMPLTLDDLLFVEEYERRGWAYKRLISDYLEREASANPGKIGTVFSTVGKKGFWPKVDTKRGVDKGCSEQQLERLAERRNRIAHTGDRVGRGRAHLSLGEVESHFKNARGIVEALDAVL